MEWCKWIVYISHLISYVIFKVIINNESDVAPLHHVTHFSLKKFLVNVTVFIFTFSFKNKAFIFVFVSDRLFFSLLL